MIDIIFRRMAVRSGFAVLAIWLAVGQACEPAFAEDKPFTDRTLSASDFDVNFSAFNAEESKEAVRDQSGEILLVQQTSPAGPGSGQGGSGSPPRPNTVGALRRSGRSRVPYMIGDTASGTCGTLTFDGAPFADVEHPTFACSRLNIAENNSPLPQDRAFVSYRHFHNISETNVLEQINAVEIDMFTFGVEKTFNDGKSSLELRVPLAYELNSDLAIIDTPSQSTLPLSDRNGEFGNMSVVFKRLLFERGAILVSGGVAVNIPTADDVVLRGDFDADIILIDDPIVITANADFTFNGLVRNDTVNLSPYLAWQATPSCRRWFHQGFFQIDIPMNRSRGDVQINGVVTPDPIFSGILPPENLDTDAFGRIDQQTLLRLNLGFGYWIHQGEQRDLLQGIAAMFEVHYTATLDKAAQFRERIADYAVGAPVNQNFPVDLVIGNQFDEINIINLTGGVSAVIGNWVVTNGCTAPVTEDENRPFDFEYNLQAHRRF